MKEEKMSKSLGNFFLVRDILAKFSPEVVRFFLLSTHYRSPLDFDDEKLAAAGRGLERIKTSIRLLTEALAREEEMRGEGDGEAGPGPAEVPGKGKEAADSLKAALDEMKASFESAMDDDFNTALAISVIFDLAREVNSLVQQLGAKISLPEKEALQKAMALFNSFNEVTGIFKVDPAGRILLEDTAAEKSGLTEGLLSLIIDIRQEARKKKDWATADRIRDGLKELGIILEDTPRGVRWKKQG